MEANCCGAVGVVEGWSLLHLAAAAAAGPEYASAADVGENSLSPLPRHLHLPSAETGGEGCVEEACHLARASHLAAVAAAVGLQFLDPFPVAWLGAWSGWGSGELGVGFPQTLGYLVLCYHCSQVMEVPQVLQVALQPAGPPSACWPFFSLTFEPAGACAAAAAAAAFA